MEFTNSIKSSADNRITLSLEQLYNKILNYLNNNQYFELYEIFRADRQINLYLDLEHDFDLPTDEELGDKLIDVVEAQFDKHVNEIDEIILNRFNPIFKHIKRTCTEGSRFTDNNTKYKISRHYIYHGIFFNSGDIMKQFIYKYLSAYIIPSTKGEESVLPRIIDTKVYKDGWQKMRTIYSTKTKNNLPNKNAVLLPIEDISIDTLPHYLIQLPAPITDNLLTLKINNHQMEYPKLNIRTINNINRTLDDKLYNVRGEFIDFPLLEQFVMALPSKYYNSGSYEPWLRVGFGIKNNIKDNKEVKKHFDLFIKFSSQSSDYDLSEIRENAYKIFNKPTPNNDKSLTTYKTIIRYLKQHDEEKYFDIMDDYNKKQYRKNINDFNNKYTHDYFTSKYSSLKMIKKGINQNEFKDDLCSTYAYINSSNPYIIVKNKDKYDIIKATTFKKTQVDNRFKIKDNNLSLYEWILLYKNHIKYRDITYIPMSNKAKYSKAQIDNHKGKFNIFTKFKANIVKDHSGESNKPDFNNLNRILDHIKLVLANNQEERYKYILDWLAHIIQRPNQKTTKLLIFKSLPGTGKNIFFNWFRSSIIGREYSTEISKLENITSKFNAAAEKKVFITLNEIKNINKRNDDSNELKNIIDGDIIQLEKKGQDAIEIEDFANYVLFTNEHCPIKITEGDRRYVVYKCSTYGLERKDNHYFTNLLTDMDKYSNLFYTYLVNRDISDFDISYCPMTKEKQLLMSYVSPPIVRFFQYIYEEHQGRIEEYDFNEDTKIHCNTLYRIYKQMILNTGDKNILTLQKFKTLIMETFDISPQRIQAGMDKARRIGFEFKYESLKKWLLSNHIKIEHIKSEERNDNINTIIIQ